MILVSGSEVAEAASPVPRSALLVSVGDDDHLVLAHEVDDPVGELLHALAPNHGHALAAAAVGRRCIRPLSDEVDAAVEVVAQPVAKPVLLVVVPGEGVEVFLTSSGMLAPVQQGHLRRAANIARAMRRVSSPSTSSTLPERMSPTRRSISSSHAASTSAGSAPSIC